MHDCASNLDSIAKGSSLFFVWCIPTSPFIHFLHLFHTVLLRVENTVVCIGTLVPRLA